MPAIQQDPIGHGKIVWLGINPAKPRLRFSRSELIIQICENGIIDDKYRGMWRKVSGHDVDYIATDGVAKGDYVLNLRQITIIDVGEVEIASNLAHVNIGRGMLRENIAISFTSITGDQQFSRLPPLSRMVIGDKDPKILILTEENGPCRTISRPIAAHYKGNTDLDDLLRERLKGRRGQMAMVRSGNTKDIRIADTFKIFPPIP